jgi:hypothetical protein
MNVLMIIIICLLSSAVLQGVGFFIYSEVYKKKFLKTYARPDLTAAHAYSLPDQTAAAKDLSKGSATKNMNAQNTKANKLSVVRPNEGTKVISNPLVLVKAQ